MWIKIIFAIIISLSFIEASNKASSVDKQHGLQMAAICLASIVALAAVVILT